MDTNTNAKDIRNDVTTTPATVVTCPQQEDEFLRPASDQLIVANEWAIM